jgi:tight adherence protein C
MIFLVVLLTFISVFIVLYFILLTYGPGSASIRMRLKAIEWIAKDRSDIDVELTRPFVQRVLSPLSGSLASTLLRVTPKAIRRMVEEKLAMGGGFSGLNTDGFLLFWGALAVGFSIIAIFVLSLAKAAPNIIVGLAMLAFAFGAALPYILLNQRIKERKKSIQKDLPDVLDILTVSVEAGLGFDGALAKLAEKMKGALVEEFTRVLQEIRVGVTRREALHALGSRCDVPDLSLFTTSLVQADQLGVSIGNVLRVQSGAMREKRRQRAQEKAMKAPIKMMLPLVLFIFPTIFVILLGPAMIQIMDSLFGK